MSSCWSLLDISRLSTSTWRKFRRDCSPLRWADSADALGLASVDVPPLVFFSVSIAAIFWLYSRSSIVLSLLVFYWCLWLLVALTVTVCDNCWTGYGDFCMLLFSIFSFPGVRPSLCTEGGQGHVKLLMQLFSLIAAINLQWQLEFYN